MKLYPARYTQMLRQSRNQENKWLIYFIALFVLVSSMLAASFMVPR